MALFAPEIVLFTAYAQYLEARVLVKKLNYHRFVQKDKSERLSFHDRTNGHDMDRINASGECSNPNIEEVHKLSVHGKGRNSDHIDIQEAAVSKPLDEFKPYKVSS